MRRLKTSSIRTTERTDQIGFATHPYFVKEISNCQNEIKIFLDDYTYYLDSYTYATQISK
jgi:hypothetical protein